VPEDNGAYTYSYYINAAAQYIKGAKAPWGGEGSHNVSKPAKSGVIRAVATQTFHYLNGGTEEKTSTKTIQYSVYDKEVTFTFGINDF